MNFILLSGGSGKRLWPLSNDVRSKQFLKILKNDAGEYESMGAAGLPPNQNSCAWSIGDHCYREKTSQ